MYRCPECNGTDLAVEALIRFDVKQANGCVQLELEGGVPDDPYWDNDAGMLCRSCLYESPAASFWRDDE